MAVASLSAAESNSLHPRVPASMAVRDMSSFAPARDGGLPSSLITVARMTSSPRASRSASSSSTLGMRRGAGEHRLKDRAGARDLCLGGRVAGGEAEAAQRLVERQPHGQQHVRWDHRYGCSCGSALCAITSTVLRQLPLLAQEL